MSKPNITLIIDAIDENPVIRLGFDFDQTLINKVKTIKSIRWSQSHRFWYIPKEEFKNPLDEII